MSECETNIHAPPVETAEVLSRCSGPVNVRSEIKSITRHNIMRFQTSSPLGQSTVISTTERLSSHEITCVCFRLSGRATKDSNNVLSMITLLPFKQVNLTCICQICKKNAKLCVYIYIYFWYFCVNGHIGCLFQYIWNIGTNNIGVLHFNRAIKSTIGEWLSGCQAVSSRCCKNTTVSDDHYPEVVLAHGNCLQCPWLES